MFEEIQNHRNMVRDNVLKGFNPDLGTAIEENALFNKGEIEYDELQKAVYADTAENRKLGRVGQEYHRGGKGKKQQDEQLPKSSRKKKENKQTTNDIKEKINKIANLLEKNADKFVSYQYSGDAEEAGITPEVAEAFDHILYDSKDIDVKQESFDWKDDDVEKYKTKLENKGYKVLELDTGDDSYWIVGLKPKKK